MNKRNSPIRANRRSVPTAAVRGLTLIFVGNGKGKTSAAIGLAVRASGWKRRVLFLQFFKSEQWPSGERASLKKLGVDVRVMGEGFVGILGDKKPRSVHKAAARKALATAKQLIRSGDYDVCIFDEAISTLEQKLLQVSALTALIRAKPQHVTICLTGHKHYPALEKLADTVTEMKMVKHPYYQGLLAQRGVDY